ncbi:hypothetical protein [Campylobacter concisus]|uniref:hypothetical protein n=1 Tax=Campylobacter concisus TaxID=199 RepID=UPI000CD982B3|nr:hypothetical protein [Campylobacter concisus]
MDLDGIYDQDLEGLAAAEETQTQDVKASIKDSQKPGQVSEENALTASNDDVKLNKEEYADFQRMRQAAQLSQMETDFRKSYPDFDMQKVTDKILEMDEKNPGTGDALLTPVGIENVYLKFFHGKTQAQVDDEFDIARGTGGGVSVKELIGKINKGEASDSEKQALYARLF